MYPNIRLILPLALAILPAARAAAFDKKEIQLERAPAAVQSAVLGHLGDGKLDELERVTFDGRTTYLAEIEFPDDRELELYISEAGAVTRMIEEIELAQAPQAVRAAAGPLGKIDDIDKHTRGETVSYQVEIDRPGADLELEISASGEVLSQTEESDD